MVSVVVCPWGTWRTQTPSWRYYLTPGDTENITLLCTMNRKNTEIEGYHFFQHLERPGTYRFGPTSKWLRRSVRVTSLTQFCGPWMDCDSRFQSERF
jgi:hypothetical protein